MFWIGLAPHSAGDQAEVFQPAPALLQGVLHKVVPYLAAGGLHQDVLRIFGDKLHAFQAVLDDDALKVLGEQHIAAAAQPQQRALLHHWLRQQDGQLG